MRTISRVYSFAVNVNVSLMGDIFPDHLRGVAIMDH